MTIDRIFLDLDGVLADWAGAAIVALGHEPDRVFGAWPAGEYDLAAAMGISGNAMWNAVHRGGAEFWATLQPYPWINELWDLCRSTAPTTILTSPSREPCSLAGKLTWLQTHFGREFGGYLVGPDKSACARRGAVLIDDREHGCHEFVARGGHAIVFPQMWNSLGRMADPIAHVRAELYRLYVGVR
jgi:hypothetical protein